MAAASIAAGFCSWLLGVAELAVLSIGGATLLLAGAAVVLTAGTPELRRSIHPLRVHAGERCEIRLVADNRTRRPSGVIEVIDRIDDHGSAQLTFAPITASGRDVATFAIATSRRGVHRVGPLRAVHSDPFGLVRRIRTDEEVAGIVVLPRVWELRDLPDVPGDEPESGPRNLVATSTVDEEFSSLRDWAPGDDVRRIHWRSTARRGAPVVRQFDVPWQRRTTVVLDMNLANDPSDGMPTVSASGVTSNLAFERAVSAAASVVQLVADRDEQVRLVCTDGTDTGFLAASEHLDDLMDLLATVEPIPADHESGPDLLRRVLHGISFPAAARIVTCSPLGYHALLAALTTTDPADGGGRSGTGNGAAGGAGTGGVGMWGANVIVATGPCSGVAPTTTPGLLLVPFVDDGLDRAWSAAVATRSTGMVTSGPTAPGSVSTGERP